jgi:DNA cross-link repair 1A protein
VCDMLGQEDVLVEVSRTFGSKIHVDGDETPDCHHRLSLLAPEILADNAAASRFHVMAFQRLTKRATEILALARARREPEPLIIRPSSQWYAFYEAPEASLHRRPVLTEPMRDEFGVWHVCLSMHSSRDELEQALGVIRPRWVVSTTPPCMAIDLSYVKKHCSLSRLGPDDCKLLGIADAMSTSVTGSPPQPPMVTVEEAIEKSEVAVTCSVEEFGSDDSSHQVEAAEPAVEGFEIRVEPPLTLFGIARFGLLQNGSQLWKDEYQSGDDVETGGAMESPAEPGLSKDGIGMPEKSVEATEIAEVATTEQNSAEPGLSKYGIGMLEKSVEATEIAEVAATEQNSAEPGLSKDGIGIPEKSVEVTEIAEVAANEQNSDTEAELQNHGKSNGEVQVTDSTDGESMLQSSSTRSELCNEDDKCVEVVKGNGEAELKAQRHGFSLHSDLLTMCRSGVTEQGRNRRKVVEEISDVRITDSAKNNKEAAEDGKKSDRDFGERAGDTSTVNGPSKGLNPNLRRLYRSMNVPVPRPLPSLVELMAASSKRPRVSQTVQL